MDGRGASSKSMKQEVITLRLITQRKVRDSAKVEQVPSAENWQ
jgi:hypothetical protein